jgi:GT2 family glycosyltransferase
LLFMMLFSAFNGSSSHFFGWYFLEINCVYLSDTASVGITYSVDNQSDDTYTLFFNVRNGKTTKRIIYVPFNVNGIELDITAGDGVEIIYKKLVWLTPQFARDRILHRLSNFHPEFRYSSKKSVKETLKSKSCSRRKWINLAYQYYNETFQHYSSSSHYGDWLELGREEQHDASNSHVLMPVESVFVFLLVDSTCDIDDIQASLSSLSNQEYSSSIISFVNNGCDKCVFDFITSVGCPIYGFFDSLSFLECKSWVGFFKAGDVFSCDFISSYRQTILSEDVSIVYSDEDSISDSGIRSDPLFKPDWNLDLFLSHNYLSGSVLFKVDYSIKNVFFSDLYNPEKFYLILQSLVFNSSVSCVAHISKVLLHSCGRDDSNIHDDLDPNDVLEFCSIARFSSAIEYEVFLPNNIRRLIWELPENLPLVSLLIPTRDGIDILQPCVDKILSLTSYSRFEVLILNNQTSCTKTLDYFKHVSSDKRVRIIDWNYPFNYSSINNFGAQHARGDIIGLINNDIEPINDDWLTEMVRQACRPDIGCVGAKLYYPNDTLQHAGVILGIGGVAGHSHRFLPKSSSGYCNRLNVVQNYSAVTAACLLVRRSVFDKVGGLTEQLAVAFNDVDFCLKVQSLGLRNLWTPFAELYHHESISRGADNTNKKRKRAMKEAKYMKDKWGVLLDKDPAYNPNLTLIHEDFSLR